MLERGPAPVMHEGASAKLHLAPWEVKTIRVRLSE
jgi:hypothetical protein